MPERLGTWPFEIALWVGRAATPNHMGRKGDRPNDTARAKTLRFKADTSRDPAAAAGSMSLVRHEVQQVFLPTGA